jgi:hypothetical protein
VTWGDPEGVTKLSFPAAGVRIELPEPASSVRLQVNNYASPTLEFRLLGPDGELARVTEDVTNEVRTVVLDGDGATAVEVRGGDNEAAVVQVCWTPLR